MTPEQIKTLKAKVEAHYKGKERNELLTDITNMSAQLQEQDAMFTQLMETKSAALAVAQSLIDFLFKDKEQLELPAELVEKMKDMKISELSSNQFLRVAAFQYGAAGSRTEQARKAVNARHNQKGGYREARAQILAIWATGEYLHHTDCAKGEHKNLGVGYETAYRYLTNAPDPDPWPSKEREQKSKEKQK